MDSASSIQHFHVFQDMFRLIGILNLVGDIWPEPAVIRDGDKFDYVIVGGGTAGCIVASRLAKFKKIKVLLIEAGGNPPFESLYPGYYPYMKDSPVDWNVSSVPEESMRNHRGGVAAIPQGKMLGGSSSLGYMTYVRGYPFDYDDWAKLTNDPSWSYDSILPLYIKLEKMLDKNILYSPEDISLHGTNGNIGLKKFYYDNITDPYFHAYEEMGNKIVVDINENNPLGFTNILYTIGKRFRQSTAYSYLRPVKDCPNLHVMTHSLVTEIVFDKNRTAVGVIVQTKDGRIIRVNANKEVILAAGAIKTPQVLMLSGIGPARLLQRHRIEVLCDLPVGQTLKDKPASLTFFKMGPANPPEGPFNRDVIPFPIIDGRVAMNQPQNYPDYELVNLIFDDTNMFLTNCINYYKYTPEICDLIMEIIGDKQLYVVFNHLLYPKSNGEVLLGTRNIKDQPEIKLGYYIEDHDVERHALQIMHANAILNTTYFQKIGAEIMDLKLRECGRFSLYSLRYWKCYVSAMGLTINLFFGTCGMGSVVDSKLFVMGVNNLRIVDASVIPHLSTPPLATVMMVAEKASEMIIEAYIKLHGIC